MAIFVKTFNHNEQNSNRIPLRHAHGGPVGNVIYLGRPPPGAADSRGILCAHKDADGRGASVDNQPCYKAENAHQAEGHHKVPAPFAVYAVHLFPGRNIRPQIHGVSHNHIPHHSHQPYLFNDCGNAHLQGEFLQTEHPWSIHSHSRPLDSNIHHNPDGPFVLAGNRHPVHRSDI